MQNRKYTRTNSKRAGRAETLRRKQVRAIKQMGF